jgi:hypothetical protein
MAGEPAGHPPDRRRWRSNGGGCRTGVVLVEVVPDGGVATGKAAGSDLPAEFGGVAGAGVELPVEVGFERVEFARPGVPTFPVDHLRADEPDQCGLRRWIASYLCADTPRPPTRSTTCAFPAVGATSSPGMGPSTCAPAAKNRWSSPATTSQRHARPMTAGGQPSRPFSRPVCAMRGSRPAAAHENPSTGHAPARRSVHAAESGPEKG